MALQNLFKKWNADRQSEAQKNEKSQTIIAEESIPSVSPVQQNEPLPASFELTLQDAASGRSFTGTFFRGCTVPAALSRAQKEGILSIPYDYLWIYTQSGKKLSRGLDSREEPGVYPGATLIVDLTMRDDPRFADVTVRQNLRKSYPLVFFRKENGACIERIEFTCYGYETPFYILQRMCDQKKLNQSHFFSILHWPVQKNTKDPFPNTQYLCEFDPEPGRVFIIEDTGMPTPCLYGCPTAPLPSQMEALQNRHVDVISYE